MTRLLLSRIALVAALVVSACRSAPSAVPEAPVAEAPASKAVVREDAAPRIEAGPTEDPALVLGEYPLAKKKPVLDGDTIKVEGLDASMRLLGIDTEETFKRAHEKEAFAKGWESYLKEMQGDSKSPVKMATPAGMEAWTYAKKFFDGVPKVRLERDHPNEIRDFYNRYLAYVFAWKDGRWVNYNVEAVRAGWSPYYVKYGRSRRFHDAFVQAEKEARAAKRGIWGDEVLHYPDYPERLRWWGARDEVVHAFETKSAGRADHVTMTRHDSLEVLEKLIGQPAVVFGQVGDIREPKSEKAPWIVPLSKSRFKSFNLVFFDKAVLDATGLAGQVREYVEVSGTVGEYRGRPQFVIDDPKQVKTFLTRGK